MSSCKKTLLLCELVLIKIKESIGHPKAHSLISPVNYSPKDIKYAKVNSHQTDIINSIGFISQ